MAQWVKVLDTKPDNVGSIFGTHTVEGENGFPQTILWLPHACDNRTPKPTHREHAQAHTHTHRACPSPHRAKLKRE